MVCFEQKANDYRIVIITGLNLYLCLRLLYPKFHKTECPALVNQAFRISWNVKTLDIEGFLYFLFHVYLCNFKKRLTKKLTSLQVSSYFAKVLEKLLLP